MSEEERFEIQIRETREIVRRMDRQVDLVERLLAESETSVRVIHGDFANSIGMELVWCPPGTFWMGSPEDEEEHYDDETLHQVTLTRGFWIGRFPVTQSQWEEVMGGNPSLFVESGPDAPVETVSWDDAQEFCRVLSQRDGREYRLPTEAEWEYACRAGSTSAWCFGDDEGKLGNYAWYDGNSADRTHPVGKKKPNAWGIHDMHGNVWEWCADWWGDYPTGQVIDPMGHEGRYIPVPSALSNFGIRIEEKCEEEYGFFRVRRGGGWEIGADRCRSAKRRRSYPIFPGIIGFRVSVGSTP